MKTNRIIEILNYPDAALVEHAVKRANLTDQEWEVIRLREYQNKTIEVAAEHLDVSDSTIKRRYQNGMEKLNKCWSALPWLYALTKK